MDQKEMEDVRQANKEYQKSITDLEGQLTSSRELAAGLEDRVEKLTREKAVLTLQRQVQHVSAGSAEAAQQEVHAEYQKVIADLEARLVAAKGEAKSLADRQAVAEMEQKVQAAEGKAKALEDEKREADLQAQVEAAQERAESLEEQQAAAEMERKAKVLEDEKRVAGLQAQVEAAQQLAAGQEDRFEKLTRSCDGRPHARSTVDRSSSAVASPDGAVALPDGPMALPEAGSTADRSRFAKSFPCSASPCAIKSSTCRLNCACNLRAGTGSASEIFVAMSLNASRFSMV